MVEGHQCHRVAAAHRKLLLNHAFEATSPNGRFTEGAAAIHHRPLRRIEVHGKNLFYFFSHSAQVATAPLLGSSITWEHTSPAPATVSVPTQAATGLQDATRPIDTALAKAPTQVQLSEIQPGSGPSHQASMTTATAMPPQTPVATRPQTLEAARPRKRARRAGRAAVADQQAPGHDSPQASIQVAAAAEMEPAAGSGTALNSSTVDDEDRVVVMRVHFGMSGSFRISTLPGPEPTPTTRLMLLNRQLGLVCHLSAMTVEHAGLELYYTAANKLGPDPLRHDADPEVLWRSIQRSRKPIGLALMTQEMIAGIGNIYRAEVLFKAGVHPEQPCNSLTHEQFKSLWEHSVQLLQLGYETGVIRTVDTQDAIKLGKPWTRRYVYNQRQCGVCKGPVRRFDMAARSVFCCETCQPLPDKSAANATAAVEAVSTPEAANVAAAHAANANARIASAANAASAVGQLLAAQQTQGRSGRGPAAGTTTQAGTSTPASPATHSLGLSLDQLRSLQPERLTVAQLKATLSSLCMSTSGRKPELVARLIAAITAASTPTTQLMDIPGPDPVSHDADLFSHDADPKVAAVELEVPTSATLGPGSVKTAGRSLPLQRSTRKSKQRSSGGGAPAVARAARNSSVEEVIVVGTDSEDEVDRAEAVLAAGLGVPTY